MKLEDWKAAIDSATASLDALERLAPKKGERNGRDGKDGGDGNGGIVEIEGDEEEKLKELESSDQRKNDIERIRAKALMRRAKARCEVGGWGGLQGAEEGMSFFQFPPWTKSEDKGD